MPALVRATQPAPPARKAGGKIRGETPEALKHDLRNLIATLELYCDLLAEPGVLRAGQEHFAADLKMVVGTSSKLLQRCADGPVQNTDLSEEPYVSDPAAAVRELYRPLSTLAGPAIEFEVECLPCPGMVRISQEDLTRILINLTRNAAEAMPQGGRIRVTLQQGGGGSFLDERKAAIHTPRTALLSVQDSGPGIPAEIVDCIFEEGFSTKERKARRRGLGLSTVRRLVENAGGSVRAFSAPGRGARFEVELLLIPAAPVNGVFSADFPERTTLEC